jgi:hypothetical protein
MWMVSLVLLTVMLLPCCLHISGISNSCTNVLSSYQAVIGGTFYYILEIVIQLRIYNTKIDYVVYFQIWPHMC